MELHPDRNATASPSLSPSNDDPSEAIVIVCCLMVVLATIQGTLANAFVIGCVIRKKTLRTSVNVLMANIAAAGLLATFTCTPTLIILLTDRPGNFRRLKVARAQYAFAIFFDAINLVSLASVGFERLQAVVRPYDKDLRYRRAYMAIGASWAISFALCLVAMLTDSDWTNMEEREWQWISMFYSDFYGDVFIPLSCLTASVILGLYVAILLLLKKQSKKLEFNAAVAPSGDTALDDKKQQIPTRLFILPENTSTEPSNPNLFLSKTEQLDPNLSISKHSASNPEADMSSNLNLPRDCPPIKINASELCLRTAASNELELTQRSEEDIAASQLAVSQTAEISSYAKTKFISNVREWQTTRHGSFDIRGTISLEKGRVKSSLTPTYPRLSFVNSLSVSNRRAAGVSSGLDRVVSMCDLKSDASVLRKSSNLVGDISVISHVLRERSKRTVEGRAAKLSAIAVAAFLFCWLPLPVIVSYQKHSGNPRGVDQTGLFLLGLSLSFLGSAVNQLVYCLVNRQLRIEFLSLCAQIANKLRKCS